MKRTQSDPLSLDRTARTTRLRLHVLHTEVSNNYLVFYGLTKTVCSPLSLRTPTQVFYEFASRKIWISLSDGATLSIECEVSVQFVPFITVIYCPKFFVDSNNMGIKMHYFGVRTILLYFGREFHLPNDDGSRPKCVENTVENILTLNMCSCL